MSKELKEFIKKVAARDCWCDNEFFTAEDYAGENIDEAYKGGY